MDWCELLFPWLVEPYSGEARPDSHAGTQMSSSLAYLRKPEMTMAVPCLRSTTYHCVTGTPGQATSSEEGMR
jgi:hypothetical protein